MIGVNLFNRYFSSTVAESEHIKQPVYSRKADSALLRAQFLSIGGGKGGVGKSFVASNLGIILSRLGKKVLIVDADLGAANLHTFIGASGAKYSLSGYLKGEVPGIEEVISKTAIPNLDLISGAKDTLDVADLGDRRIARLHAGLKEAEYDYILLDNGPGTSSNLLDIFMMGDEGVLITTPEPTSIENTYRFLKCLILRKVKKVLDSQGDSRMRELLINAFNEKGAGRPRTIRETFEHIRLLDQKEIRELLAAKDNMKISVIINQTRRPEDHEVGHLMNRVCYDYFGINLNYLGYIGFSEFVSDSIRGRRPLTVHYKDSEPVREMEKCLQGLINRKIQVTI